MRGAKAESSGWRTCIGWLVGLLAAVAGAQAAQLPNASDELFTNNIVRHLRIEISPEGMATLRQYRWQRPGNPEARVPVPGTIHEGTAVYTNVAIHLKGAAGSFRPVDSKPGLTLKFDKNVEGQRFHGLAKINLNNSVQDRSYISDKLCRELFTQADVPVPRADYATVELNGRPLGLYVLTEGWDKHFLKRYFQNTKGNFYDPPQAWDITKPLRASSGEKPNDNSELAALAAAAKDPDLTHRLGQIQKLVDFDRFLNLLVLDVMLWNWDGYAMNKNNYRVFHDLDTQRIVFMPHGMDQMFWNPEGPIVTGRNGTVARGLLQTAEGRRLYLARFRQLRANIFNLQAITNRVAELGARLHPVLAKISPGAAPQHDHEVDLLRGRIVARAQSMDEQLAGVKNLLEIATNQTVALSGWRPQTVLGKPTIDKTTDPAALHLATDRIAAGAWAITVWLEEGVYTVEGRLKTRDVLVSPNQPVVGAGLRVWSDRKLTDGVHWGWFPFRESNDYIHRGEVASTNCVNTRLTGTSDWKLVKYEIELRNPIADLEVLCELYAKSGEAWFDPNSLKITRKTDICP